MRYLLYTVAFLTIVPAAIAQNPGSASLEHDRGWVTLGLGLGYPSDLSKVATVNLGRKRAFQVGYHVGSGSSHSVRVVNVGLGHSLVGRWSRIAGFVGPAVSWGFAGPGASGSDGSGHFTTIGASANAQVIFTPVKEIGIGATLWGNLNSERNVGGLGMVLVFEGNK
jgi:hypothetical protein